MERCPRAVLLTFAFWAGASSLTGSQQLPNAGQTSGSPAEAEWKAESAGSIIRGALTDPKNRFGVSFGLSEGYADNIFRSSVGGESAWATTFEPGLFLNAGKPAGLFHADYSLLPSVYTTDADLDIVSHRGHIGYFRPSPTAKLRLWDTVASSPEDFGALDGRFSPPDTWLPIQGIEPVYERQRITQNRLQADTDIVLSPNSDLDISGMYLLYRATFPQVGDTDALQLAARFSRDGLGPFTFSASYSAYLTGVADSVRPLQLHRLQPAALRYRLSHSWLAEAGCGVDLAGGSGAWRSTPGAYAALSGSSQSSALVASYQRGFTSSTGTPGLYVSDIWGVEIGQMLRPWMSYRASFSYSLNHSTPGEGFYGLMRGEARVEFELRSGLVALADYAYWDQWRQNLTAPVLDTTRWAVRFGLEYVWAAVRR